ncbi:hypothetical protein DW1_0620 [Proteiniborus sp. DW1]|uniref:hypothetical protein n=1 Tax=Proteiniborus sp. DW1 TaxID=1889883 RepID=UPI00092E0336|nr:hypothetical protein [Proteiniborus sp. DW1]SCG82229.1 hypothetical protein DW1_0620 [Proteiniborus sp. DW1]
MKKKMISLFMTLVLVFTFVSASYAYRDDYSIISPNYVPCDYTGGQHIYVDGHEWQDDEETTHWHKISDGYGGYIYVLCTIITTYKYTEQRCPCGESKVKRTKLYELHYRD